MSAASGLVQFAAELDPDVVRDIQSWSTHDELNTIAQALHAPIDRGRFFSMYAEAVIARRLLAQGCSLKVEVETPAGKSCDFHVRHDDLQFYLHVKYISTAAPTRLRSTVASRLRYLERIARPYVVSVRWRDDADDRQMQRLVTSAAEFINHARVGDELVVHDDDGSEIGGCLIVAPTDNTHVSLVVGGSKDPHIDRARIQRLLRKAYQQFMPGELNVILVGTSHRDDIVEFESALLGAHIERWDQFPARDRRIAHGRAADGFWSAGRYAESTAAGWFRIAADQDSQPSRIWFRDDGASIETTRGVRHKLEQLFTSA